jgi:hypothetical protein
VFSRLNRGAEPHIRWHAAKPVYDLRHNLRHPCWPLRQDLESVLVTVGHDTEHPKQERLRDARME